MYKDFEKWGVHFISGAVGKPSQRPDFCQLQSLNKSDFAQKVYLAEDSPKAKVAYWVSIDWVAPEAPPASWRPTPTEGEYADGSGVYCHWILEGRGATVWEAMERCLTGLHQDLRKVYKEGERNV